MHEVLACLEAPSVSQNYNDSYLTFRSMESFMWGLIGLFQSAAVTFCDQASWQSRIAAKPSDGVIGFLVATALWFSIPSALGTTAGMAYLVMSYQNGTHLLTNDEISLGMTTPLVVQSLFGKTGAFLVLVMSSMAYMSTGSGEVMSVSSILVYDIYQIHINPFRPGVPKDHCKFCSKLKDASLLETKDLEEEECRCPTPEECLACKKDIVCGVKSPNSVRYTCRLHADLRQYQADLIRYKSWCIIWVSILVIPLGLILYDANITLNWIFLYGVMLTVCTFPGVVLSVLWHRTTRLAVFVGSATGLCVTIVLNTILASQQNSGLGDFFTTSVEIVTVFSSGGAALVVTFGLTIFISLFQTWDKKTRKSAEEIWSATQDIDNPLHPWSDRFTDEVPDLKKGERPTLDEIYTSSRTARIQAYVGSGTMITILILVIPITMVSFPILDLSQFKGWLLFCVIWACTIGTVAIIMVPIQEVLQILRRMKLNRQKTGEGTFNKRMSIASALSSQFDSQEISKNDRRSSQFVDEDTSL